MKLFVRSWEYRHPKLLWGGRIAAGTICFSFGILLLFSYRSLWGLLPLAGAAAAFFGGYGIYQVTRSRPAA